MILPLLLDLAELRPSHSESRTDCIVVLTWDVDGSSVRFFNKASISSMKMMDGASFRAKEKRAVYQSRLKSSTQHITDKLYTND